MIDFNLLKNKFEIYNLKRAIDDGELVAFDTNLTNEKTEQIKQRINKIFDKIWG